MVALADGPSSVKLEVASGCAVAVVSPLSEESEGVLPPSEPPPQAVSIIKKIATTADANRKVDLLCCLGAIVFSSLHVSSIRRSNVALESHCRVHNLPKFIEVGEGLFAFFPDRFNGTDELAGIIRHFTVDANDITVHAAPPGLMGVILTEGSLQNSYRKEKRQGIL
jgi:hypothetical protein